MSEIKLNYNELKYSIEMLWKLEEGTGYALYATSEFINHSRGKMYASTNAFYKKLMNVETALIDIIKNTNKALLNAGVAFEESDSNLSKKINQDVR